MKALLLSTILVAFDQNVHLPRLQAIDDENFETVKKKVRADLLERGREVTDDFLEEGILALKQYYAVALLDPMNMHAISDELDHFWHAHILLSRQYVPFCNKVIGTYIHHLPLDKTEKEKVDYAAKVYNYSSTCMREMFSNISETFYPQNPTAEQLVCLHANDGNGTYDSLEAYPSEVIEKALRPRISEMGNMELFIGAA